MQNDTKAPAVPALERALNILEYIAEANQPVCIKELAVSLEIPSASCFRLVKDLSTRGYLSETGGVSSHYDLGINVLKIANQFSKRLNVRTLAIPSMRRIAASVNHTVQLGVLRDYKAIIIEQIIPSKGVSVVAPTGESIPINVCASGKVICAHLTADIRMKTIYNTTLETYTDFSITDKETFLCELDQVRRQGYATDNQEYSLGVACLAVPIFDINKLCVAAIGTVGHYAEYQDLRKKENILDMLRGEAQIISEALGSSPS